MRSVLCMSLGEQQAMLKELGFGDVCLRYNLQENPSKPYCMDGMADGDPSAVDIHFSRVQAQIPAHRKGLTGESFVDLEHIDGF